MYGSPYYGPTSSGSSYPMAMNGNGSGSKSYFKSTYAKDYSAPRRYRDSFNRTGNAGLSSAAPSQSYLVGRPYGVRSVSLSPENFKSAINSTRSLIRNSFQDEDSGYGLSGSSSKLKSSSPAGFRGSRSRASMTRESTRDQLIDSIIHTRTREHRPLPGYRDATSWEERRLVYDKVDCDKVYPGILLANGETVQNIDYLKSIGVTHVLNTAERHVNVNPGKFPCNNISYFGFHVDDHPSANISRFFGRTSEYIDEALRKNGVVVVNCVMGWSRSASVVAAYLISKKGMSSSEALEQIRRHRPIRPNPGFLQQIAGYENLLKKRLVW